MLFLLAACAGAPTKTPDSAAPDSTPPEPVHAGALTTLLADSQGGDDVLWHPDGFLVVSDPLGDGSASAPAGTALRRVELDGRVSVYADGLVRPLGNDIDAQGRVYAAEWGGEGRVFRVSPEGDVEVLTSGLSYASNMVAHPDGALYVTDWDQDTVYRVSEDGEREVFAQGEPLAGPVGIALDLDGASLLVASFDHGRIYRLDPDGGLEPFAELPEAGYGATADLVVTPLGVFVTSFGGHRVYRVSPEGEVELFAGTGEVGGADGPALEGSLNQPNGIAASADGRTLWVQEFGGALRVIEVLGGE
ncbi:MAG: SMP-30/gluconolactonase/LRE family protein [Alphaproteobacteria bacterium]|nr:SMP-30/gluconolactonase/LRE family protein [Alphaproteobacteria bacterium]